jgi:tetratricopeptide (TPR) repeat protein
MNARRLLTIIAATVSLTVLAAGGEETRLSGFGKNPSVSPPTVAQRLAPFIAMIKETDNPGDVMSAYARGTAIDANNVALNEAYIRKLLRMGLPQIAYFPALTLAKVDPNNGTALGVIGYNFAKKGDLDHAIPCIVTALDIDPCNPGLLHTGGQLVAMYDAGLDPIDRPTVVLIERLRPELMAMVEFSQPFEATTGIIRETGKSDHQANDALPTAEAELLKLQEQALACDRQIHQLEADLGRHIQAGTELGFQASNINSYSVGQIIPSGLVNGTPVYGYESSYNAGGSYYSRLYTTGTQALFAQGLASRIQDEVAATQDAQNRLDLGKRQVQPVYDRLKAAQAKVALIRHTVNEPILSQVLSQVKWAPPAVDGVVTPELAMIPPMRNTRFVPTDSKTEVNSWLQLGRNYADNGMTDKAIEYLDKVVERYPRSNEAVQARTIREALVVPK